MNHEDDPHILTPGYVDVPEEIRERYGANLIDALNRGPPPSRAFVGGGFAVGGLLDPDPKPCAADKDHCWHRYGNQMEKVGGFSLWHCCRPGCADVLASDREREEKTHGYVKGWRPKPGGMEPPRLHVREEPGT